MEQIRIESITVETLEQLHAANQFAANFNVVFGEVRLNGIAADAYLCREKLVAGTAPIITTKKVTIGSEG